MRIDPNSRTTAPESAATTASGRAGSAPGGQRSKDAAGSPALQTRAGALAAQVNQLPEVRQKRVAAIASAVREGTYRVSPEQTAEAILSELHARSGAAA